jgi:hypothetical protein
VRFGRFASVSIFKLPHIHLPRLGMREVRGIDWRGIRGNERLVALYPLLVSLTEAEDLGVMDCVEIRTSIGRVQGRGFRLRRPAINSMR